MENRFKKSWQQFIDQELIKASLVLAKLGFSLDEKQKHISGERYLSSYSKLVLLGRRDSDGKRVIIKLSSDLEIKKEINDEVNSRKVLHKINFAYHVFFSPAEILFTEGSSYTILITEFIEQDKTFLERPLKEQFFIALKAFEAQEAIHATTYEHASIINKAFGIWRAKDYINSFEENVNKIREINLANIELDDDLSVAREFLKSNITIIDLYSNFLTHWDFVPHNFRIRGNDMYLLDHSSIRFGNKYEGWARFLNFMSLHNQDLEKLLLDYIRDNRNKKEYLALRLMRVFRLTELILYYAHSLENVEGNLRTLNKKRIDFWTEALRAVLDDRFLDKNIIATYTQTRDILRDKDEKQRQIGLH